jgi:hypothetical protein
MKSQNGQSSTRGSFLSRHALLLVVLPVLTVGCGGGSNGSGDLDPIVEDFGIAYVRRPVTVPDQSDVREVLPFNAGGDLFFRDLASPSAAERNVTISVTGGLGDVKDVEVSFDGAKLVFAMRLPDPDPTDDLVPTWNIWEFDIDTQRLQRVIPSDITAEEGEDVTPHYLPDGRIIFSSTRQRHAKATLLDEGKPQFDALDEDRNERALVLHVMNADGSDIHQVSFNQSHDFDPAVLGSGDVVFSRWDNMGSRSGIRLYRMKPDGSELELLYGAQSHNTGTNGSTIEFLQAHEMQDGRLMTIVRPVTGTAEGGDIVLIDVGTYVENNQSTLPVTGLPGPAQIPATINDVYTDGTPSPGGRYSAAYPIWDGTDRALVSWSPCRLIANNRIVPCTPQGLAAPNVQEAPPVYGVWIADLDADTQVPIVAPQEGFMYTDAVAARPRVLPPIIFDKVPGVELDASLAAEGVGVLHIRSVYDFDGSYNNLGAAAPDTTTLADPALTTADQRPARFLRIVKAVGIPDGDVIEVPSTAFGRSTQQLMREIIGYAPVQPDGSVKVKVPANVPLAISVLDKNGWRIGDRHQNWIQVLPGETVSCNGCHAVSSGMSHGRRNSFASINAGAPVTGLPFPNTDPALFADFGETMAETLSRSPLIPNALEPSVDLAYDDVWTDPAVRAKDDSFSFGYADLTTSVPTTAQCQTSWSNTCRIIINYEQHIQPLWEKDRGVAGADRCDLCHNSVNAMGQPQVPDGQLDLTGGPSNQEPDHFTSYRELLFTDNQQELNMGVLQDTLVPGPIDPTTGLPVPVSVPIAPAMSTAGAQASASFFSRFNAGASHEGRLDPGELKLIAEWLDIGAQYYNNPFDVPQP